MLISDCQFGDWVGRYRNVLYLCHRNADPDAIGSSFALARAFGGRVGAVEDLSRTGEWLAGIIGADILFDPDCRDFDLVVLVDTSVQMQLGGVLPERYALVDHHLDRGLLDGAIFYIQRPATSTAQIVWSILKENGRRPGREEALGLLAGMISDTGRFKRATAEAFSAASGILQAGGFSYEEALSALSVPADISQRIAVLKAASRARVERHGDWLIATAEVGSFEGSAAMALVELGADAAFVAGRHGDSTRISARCSRKAAERLNLAGLLSNVAAEHGGAGGGHQAAAALEARASPAALLDACRRGAEDRLPGAA